MWIQYQDHSQSPQNQEKTLPLQDKVAVTLELKSNGVARSCVARRSHKGSNKGVAEKKVENKDFVWTWKCVSKAKSGTRTTQYQTWTKLSIIVNEASYLGKIDFSANYQI